MNLDLNTHDRLELRELFLDTIRTHTEILKLTKQLHIDHNRLIVDFEIVIKEFKKAADTLTKVSITSNKVVEKALLANQKVLETFMRLA